MNDDNGLSSILENRGEDYGDYIGNCETIEKMMKLLEHRMNQNPRMHPTMRMVMSYTFRMVIVKMVRLAMGDPAKRDSWMDLAGYPRIALKKLEKGGLVK